VRVSFLQANSMAVCLSLTRAQIVTAIEMMDVPRKMHGLAPTRKFVNIGPSLVPPMPAQDRGLWFEANVATRSSRRTNDVVDSTARLAFVAAAYADERRGGAE
jgi:hypothetical protein